MYRILIFSVLFLFWVVLSGHFDGFHLALGVVCAGIVTWLSSDLFFQDRSRNLSQRWREISLGVGYFAWLLNQIVKANIVILKLALSPNGVDDVAPRVVRFRTKLRSDFARYLLAQSITLTPGTVTIKIAGDEFFVHAINQEAADGLDRSMEGWIAHIFEPGTETDNLPS